MTGARRSMVLSASASAPFSPRRLRPGLPGAAAGCCAATAFANAATSAAARGLPPLTGLPATGAGAAAFGAGFAATVTLAAGAAAFTGLAGAAAGLVTTGLAAFATGFAAAALATGLAGLRAAGFCGLRVDAMRSPAGQRYAREARRRHPALANRRF